MERCDYKPNGDCLAYRGELPANQTCVEKRVSKQKPICPCNKGSSPCAEQPCTTAQRLGYH